MVDQIKTRPGRQITAAASSPAARHPEAVTLRFGGAMVGTLVEISADGEPLIDFPANPTFKHLLARTCVDLATADVGKDVVLQFDEGDSLKPIVMGVIRLPGTSQRQAAPVRPTPTSVELDGEAVELVAVHTLTLRCGSASITLTSDGKVLVRGTQIHTRASALNRIQGASVRIN